MTLPSVQDVLQQALDAYANPRIQASEAADFQQIQTLRTQVDALQALVSQDDAKVALAQQQLAAAQSDLAAALAAGKADLALVTQLQRQVATLQAQLNAALPGKAPAPPPGWVEVFRDDMNGALGPLWAVADNTGANNELSWRLASNVQAGLDHMSIHALRQPVGGRQFGSGYIATTGRFSVPFGRWLVRARWDDLYGLWPAIWLRDDQGLGEIDIVEAVGTVRKVVQTVHQSTNGDMDKAGNEWAMPGGWRSSDWHTYGLQRDNTGTLTWTIDGQAVFSRTRADLGSKSHQPMTWLTGAAFPTGQHLIINLQVGGSMPTYYLGALDTGKILPAGSAASMDIDYVQVLTPVAA